MRSLDISVAATVAGFFGLAVMAGPDEVKLPESYQTTFVNYVSVDHCDFWRVLARWYSAYHGRLGRTPGWRWQFDV
jgi:hypothetical protein